MTMMFVNFRAVSAPIACVSSRAGPSRTSLSPETQSGSQTPEAPSPSAELTAAGAPKPPAGSGRAGVPSQIRQYLFQSAVDFLALIVGAMLLLAVSSLASGSSLATIVAASFHETASLLPAILVISIVITALHWFVGPVLVMVFGGWFTRTYGLAALIIDIVLFSVASFIVPVVPGAGSTPWWAIPVGAVLYRVLAFAIGALVGLNRPSIAGPHASAWAWRLLVRLPGSRNRPAERLRLLVAYTTFVSYGLEIALAGTPIGSIRRSVTRIVYGRGNPVDGLSAPAMIRRMLQQLGPTYVKVGQLASTMSDTLPPAWTDELSRLQSQVPAVPFADARGVILRQFGKPPEELFRDFEPDAFAAASIAQVHRATLHDGTRVAVKVQRPDIEPIVNADLGVIRDMARVLEGVSGDVRDLDLSGIVDEFAEGVARELDYRREAYNARRLAEGMDSLPMVHVPAIYPELSGQRVLTMEFINGAQLTTPDVLARAGLDPDLLTKAFLRAFLKQMVIDGFFHADPHPGNVVLDLDRGALTYLDLGLVGTLDAARRIDLIDLLASIKGYDADGLASLALRLTRKTRPVDAARFRDDVAEMLNQHVRYATSPGLGSVVAEFFGMLQRHGLRLDARLTLAIKAVVQSEAVVSALGGNVDVLEFAVGEIGSLTLAQITPEWLKDTVKQQVTHVGKELLRRAPDLQGATLSWLDQFMKGRLEVRVDTSALREDVDNVTQAVGRLSAALIMTGMIVAVAIVTTQIWQAGSQQESLALLATGGLVMLLVIGAWLCWRILRPPKRPYKE